LSNWKLAYTGNKFGTIRNAESLCTNKKALYGTLQAALLFWKLLSTTLQEWGFKINEYDQCVQIKSSMEKNVQ